MIFRMNQKTHIIRFLNRFTGLQSILPTSFCFNFNESLTLNYKTMKNIVILGAGMVGKAIAIDLSKKYKVKSVDIDTDALHFLFSNYSIETHLLDVTQKKKCPKPLMIVI